MLSSPLLESLVALPGGVAGAKFGAYLGAKCGSVFGVPGSIICGIIGSIVGACAAAEVSTSLTKKILDTFIEDDAVKMLKIFEKSLEDLSQQYLLGEREIQTIIKRIKDEKDLPDFLTFMFYIEKTKSAAFSLAYTMLEEVVEEELERRPLISLPSDKEILQIQHEILLEA